MRLAVHGRRTCGGDPAGAREARWPSALAVAHYAAGLANPNPVAGLEHLNRGVALAAEVGNRKFEAMCQTLVIALQSALLPTDELAVALIRLLRHIQDRGDTGNAMLPLSQVVVLLHEAGKSRTAALICGWLDGRSGRSVQSIGDHDAAVASVLRALGDQWDPLFQQGRSMTTTQVLHTACDELQTICERSANGPRAQ